MNTKLVTDLRTTTKFLENHYLHNMQRSVHKNGEVELFHPVYLSPLTGKFEGYIWTPNYEIQYEIDVTLTVPPIEIVIGTGDLAADLEKVKSEIPFLRKTALLREAAAGGGGPGKKGYYLIVGVAKATALQRFQEALKEGIGSHDFISFSVPRSFKMMKF